MWLPRALQSGVGITQRVFDQFAAREAWPGCHERPQQGELGRRQVKRAPSRRPYERPGPAAGREFEARRRARRTGGAAQNSAHPGDDFRGLNGLVT